MPLDQPRPDAATVTRVACPACGHPFVWPPTGRCERCAVDLASDQARHVFDLDRRWAALAAERLALVGELEATRPAGEEVTAGTGAAPPPVSPGGRASSRSSPTGRGVPALLGLAGVALLTAAAVVFTAVAWTTLPALAKAAILLAATAAAAAGALRLHARGITTAGAALGALTMTLALVDVAGADRVGLVTLDDFAIPLGLLVAAAAGWGLARQEVGWVSELGVVAAALGALGLTVTIADAADLAPPVVTLLGTAASALLGATTPGWPTPTARRLAALLATAGVTVAGLVSVLALPEEGTGVAAALGAIAVTIAVTAAATRWTTWALTPTTLLGTTTVVAAAAALGTEEFGVATVVAATVAVVAWVLTIVGPDRRGPVLLGGLPVAAGAAGMTLAIAAVNLEELWVLLTTGEAERLDPWATPAVALVALAVAAWPPARRRPAVLVPAAALLAAVTLPPTGAWIALAVVALILVVAERLAGRDLGAAGAAALAVGVVAIGWASPDAWSVAMTAGVAGAVAAHVVWHTTGVRAVVAAGIGTSAAALGGGAALAAVGATWVVTLGGGLVVALGLAAALQAWSRSGVADAGLATAAVATSLVPMLADDAAASGVLLLVGAVGWLAVAVAGWWPGRWVTSVVASVGTAVLLADADVAVVEAYTAVPALTLGAVGVLWLRRDREVRTLTALWPALSAAVVPSTLTLADDPDVLLRALLLAGLAGALAGIGVALRWLAPVLAGVVAAVGVALTQLAVVADVVPRWVTFAVVGLLLVWLAATYERQQARARALAGRLSALR